MGKKHRKKQKVPAVSDALPSVTTHNTNIARNNVGDAKAQTSSVSKHLESKNESNPLLSRINEFLQKIPKKERDGFFSNELVDPERRATLWMDQADLGERLVSQYSWAIPDARAIAILKHFSPLIEIGCGANAYWCRLLVKLGGVDIVGYDQNPSRGGRIKKENERGTMEIDFKVRQGGPEVLREASHAGRTLFLCYPDEGGEEEGNTDEDQLSASSLGAQCLREYQGKFVIHVGELFFDQTLSIDQAPWGRSSGPEFQQLLAKDFHCLLHVRLPSWLHTCDSLSVWKRSETCSIVFAADTDGEEDGESDEEFQYRYIPMEERLPVDRAAPCLQHLLKKPSSQAISSTEVLAGIIEQNDANGQEELRNHNPRKKKRKQATQT